MFDLEVALVVIHLPGRMVLHSSKSRQRYKHVWVLHKVVLVERNRFNITFILRTEHGSTAEFECIGSHPDKTIHLHVVSHRKETRVHGDVEVAVMVVISLDNRTEERGPIRRVERSRVKLASELLQVGSILERLQTGSILSLRRHTGEDLVEGILERAGTQDGLWFRGHRRSFPQVGHRGTTPRIRHLAPSLGNRLLVISLHKIRSYEPDWNVTRSHKVAISNTSPRHKHGRVVVGGVE